MLRNRSLAAPDRPARGFRPPAAFAMALLVTVACASPPAEAPRAPGEELDLRRPERERPSFPPGLTPCAKDAPEGEGCAVKARAGDAGAGPASATTAALDETVWAVPLGPDDPTKGPPDALVTLVVFSDFQCPFCRRAAPMLDRLVAEHPADVRLVWKDVPLPQHEHAEPAAELARVARAAGGDAAFWKAHDLLYEAQSTLGDATFRRIADDLDLPWARVASAIQGKKHGAVIQASVALADRVDVRATPTTYVNGRKLVGAKRYEQVLEVVSKELERARGLVAAGTPRAALYATLIRGGKQLRPATDLPADP